MSEEDEAAAIKAVLDQLNGVCEHYVFYGSTESISYWAVADKQKRYVSLGLLAEAAVVEQACQDKDIRMSVHNALPADGRDREAGEVKP